MDEAIRQFGFSLTERSGGGRLKKGLPASAKRRMTGKKEHGGLADVIAGSATLEK